MSTTPVIKRSLSKTLNAPTEKVFDSWLIPAVVGRWMVGPAVQAEQVVELQNNVRPRGDYSFALTRSGKDVTITGEYRVIDRPARLEFSWLEAGSGMAETIVSAQFNTEDGRTKVKVTLTLPEALAPQADNIKQLWQVRLTALAALLNK